MHNLQVNPQQGIVTTFLVNGVNADTEHFCAEDLHTGRYLPKSARADILSMYKIGEKEFRDIANELACKTSKFCINCD